MKKFGLNSPSGDKYAVLKKGLIVMKITLLMILISTFNLLATDTYSQTARVSLKLNQASVKQVLKEIERSSEFYFLYNNDLIDVERKVDIQADNEQINSILDRLFANQEANYAVYDRQIVISPVNMPLPQSAQRKVTGKVTDQSGAPIPGVTVLVKGTTTGIITDSEGNYSISNIPENSSMQFSFVGMKSLEIAIRNQTTINVMLIEEAIDIEEVVAIGYGTQKKVNLTGSVSSVTSHDLIKSPVQNPLQSLQGRTPGLSIMQESGYPGDENYQIQIRGLNSYGSSTSPLIIVDGVVGSLGMLNPKDIESISVLKDASSSAIYGARAANGVILITTRSGKIEPLNIQYSSNFAIHNTIMPFDFMDFKCH